MNAYIVTGPEASGNRYIVSLLCSAGCSGKSDHNQPFDTSDYSIQLPEQKPDLIAFHRSLPHGGTWPNLPVIIYYLRQNGYKTTLLVPIRNQNIIEKSQVANQHVQTIEEARTNIKKAFQLISTTIHITHTECYFIPYKSLGDHSYLEWLFSQLNLNLIDPEPFVDGDIKYHRKLL